MPSKHGAAKIRRSPPRSSSRSPVLTQAYGSHEPERSQTMPEVPGDLRLQAYAAISDPGPDCTSSPASSSGSVQSKRKSCQYDRWWACIRSMLASDVSDGSSVVTQTYRMHAHRPIESTTPSVDLPNP